MHRRSDDTLHWVLGDVVPPDLADAINAGRQQASEERLRLLYVACTRAMDLLVLPEFSWSGEASWARAVDFKLDQLPELNITHFAKRKIKSRRTPEQAKPCAIRCPAIRRRVLIRTIRWIWPSDGDPDLVSFEVSGGFAWDHPAEPFW